MLAFLAEIFFSFIINILLAFPGGLLRASVYWVRYKGRIPFKVLLWNGNAGMDVFIGALMICLVCAVMIFVT